MSSIWCWKLGGDDTIPKYHSVSGDHLALARDDILAGYEYDYATTIVDLPMIAERPYGMYRLRTAEAVSEIHRPNGKYSLLLYRLQFKFKELADAKELLLLIMDGKIWPEVCLDNLQVPPPARHLRQLLREAWGIIRREVSMKLHARA